MQVGQLKEIIALIKRINEKEKDYYIYFDEDILNLSYEDAFTILENKNNGNVRILINFLVYWGLDEYREPFRKKLGLVKDDEYYKNIIIEKILGAENIDVAQRIFSYFDDECLQFNEEEWLMFLKGISSNFSSDKLSSLLSIIKLVDKCRLQVIEKVMLCFKNNLDIDENLVYELNKLSEEEILTFLDLYNIQYEWDVLINLIEKMKNEDYKDESVKIVNYLKNPKLFDKYLPNVFLNTKKEEVDDILKFLPQITISNILPYYTEVDERFGNDKLLRMFTEKLQIAYILDKVSLVDAYGALYENDEYFDTLLSEKINAGEMSKLEKILECLRNVYDKDSDMLDEYYNVLVKLLSYFEYDEWKTLIESQTLDSINYIYENKKLFAKFMDGLELKEIINKLKNISVENLDKIRQIINFSSFKKQVNNKKVFELMLSENGRGSIDYIYHVYLEEERRINPIPEVSKQVQNNGIKLLTVYELLAADNDIGKVLDGFRDDEEVNSKTLIRTFAYRNDTK